MELTFNKVNNWYEAEFEIAGDINLHIELNVAAPIKLYQKTSGDKYDLVQAFKPSIDKVLDTDLMALVYPKCIKVVSEAEVTRAVVLPEGVAKQTGGVKTTFDASKQSDLKELWDLLNTIPRGSDGNTLVDIPVIKMINLGDAFGRPEMERTLVAANYWGENYSIALTVGDETEPTDYYLFEYWNGEYNLSADN
jgi:hypothetical protein